MLIGAMKKKLRGRQELATPARREPTRLPSPPILFQHKKYNVCPDDHTGGKRWSEFAVGCMGGPCLKRSSPLVYAAAGNREGLQHVIRRVFIAHTQLLRQNGGR